MWAWLDFYDLWMIVLFDDLGWEFGFVNVFGKWG